MKSLNYHHLMYFREIATEKTMALAAAKLNLGQPALSGQLKKLEEQLGQQLFERKNRALILTEAGKFTLQLANEIYQAGNHLMEVMEKGSLVSKIELKLGALDSVPKHLILKLISDAQNTQECRVTLIEGRSDYLLRELQAQSVDIIILNFHAPVSERRGISSRSLAKNHIAVFGSRELGHLKKRFPQSLSGQPFILPTLDSKLRHDIEHYFRVHDLALEVAVETQDISVQKLLGVQGAGLVALPEFAVQDLVEEKKLIRLGRMENIFEEYWLISAKRTLVNPIAAKLIQDFSFTLI